jgi:hypothetical protein
MKPPLTPAHLVKIKKKPARKCSSGANDRKVDAGQISFGKDWLNFAHE